MARTRTTLTKGIKWSKAAVAKRVATRYPPSERADRFWALVNRVDSVCWEWLGYRTACGYGNYFGNGAHRAALKLTGTHIPDGWEVDHLCKNRGCVRPDHLRVVPPGFNGKQGAAYHQAKTHCPRGHEYTPENTYRYRNGRFCRECHRVATYAYWKKTKARSARG